MVKRKRLAVITTSLGDDYAIDDVELARTEERKGIDERRTVGVGHAAVIEEA